MNTTCWAVYIALAGGYARVPYVHDNPYGAAYGGKVIALHSKSEAERIAARIAARVLAGQQDRKYPRRELGPRRVKHGEDVLLVEEECACEMLGLDPGPAPKIDWV